MRIDQVERAVLAVMFNDKTSSTQIKAELSADKFVFGPSTDGKVPKTSSHKLIYRSMLSCKEIDPIAVAINLGDDLDRVGGEAYLGYLSSQFLNQMGIMSSDGLGEWVTFVDRSGRLKAIGDVVESSAALYENFLMLVENVEDVDQFGSDIVQRMTTILLGTSTSGYQHIATANNEYARRVEDEASGEIVTYYPMGWPSFSRYGLPPQDALFVLSGLSGIGKTQIMLQMGLGVAIQLKHNGLSGRVLFNSYEMAGWRLSRRIASCLSGVNYQSKKLKDTRSKEYSQMMQALEFVSTLPIFYDDTDMTSNQIRLQALKLAAEEPVYFIGIDYAEELPDEDPGSEELRVSRIFRNSKGTARATGACVCLLSQLSDVSKFPSGIVPYNRLRYSRAGTNAADVIAYLYNPPQMRKMRIPFTFDNSLGDESMAYLLIQKYRDGEVTSIPLLWYDKLVRFEDPILKKVGGRTELYQHIEDLGYVDGEFIAEDF